MASGGSNSGDFKIEFEDETVVYSMEDDPEPDLTPSESSNDSQDSAIQMDRDHLDVEPHIERLLGHQDQGPVVEDHQDDQMDGDHHRLENVDDNNMAGEPNQNHPLGEPAEPAAAKNDIDLFESDEQSEEADKAREERAQAAPAKKKTGVVAKSNVVLEIKPWSDETDLGELEKAVRSVAMQGLLWGKSELKPVAFGVKKLQIVCVIEDDHVSIEELSEKIEAFEDYVQSVDVVAFNKI